MCEFCHKHGQVEKWYLQAKNYSDDLLHEKKGGRTEALRADIVVVGAGGSGLAAAEIAAERGSLYISAHAYGL